MQRDLSRLGLSYIHKLSVLRLAVDLIKADNQIYGEEVEVVKTSDESDEYNLSRLNVKEGERAFTELRDTIINDVPMRMYIPHNAELTLHVGKMDRDDKSVIYTAEAAFIRAVNHAILGAFVLKGEPLAWGLSMRGYCASINGVVTVGVADNSPLFEEAINEGGYFFRQYPLVDNGRFVAMSLRISRCVVLYANVGVRYS